MTDLSDTVKKTVLIVDDERSIGDILAEYMRLLGYQAVLALDCDDVINYFDSQKPDIVFLDIRLPKVNGVTLLRLLKKLEPDLPVIMMSGVATIDVARTSLKIGAFDYLTKPFSYERISDILRAVELSVESEEK